ncbi:hypothetical protein GGX14DRAFT_389154 [Mycena pura]|uniref:Uncharacterized protein n=1 Tax=Mycena pura TaxID=153505 RepID=A0AAD6VRS8_9AGAR|nr:hypothetical protein GGX14DRAFT_389154 [Mycena pura]
MASGASGIGNGNDGADGDDGDDGTGPGLPQMLDIILLIISGHKTSGPPASTLALTSVNNDAAMATMAPARDCSNMLEISCNRGPLASTLALMGASGIGSNDHADGNYVNDVASGASGIGNGNGADGDDGGWY